LSSRKKENDLDACRSLGWLFRGNLTFGINMRGHYSETLGQYLKRERESRTVSIEELSNGTRISCPFLEALEKDDFSFFPQREFIPGFLKGYARYVGLDAKEVLSRYQMQSELEGRKETFRQLSLFPTISPAAEEIQDPVKESQKIPAFKFKKRYHHHRNIFIKLAIVLIALGLTLYIHHLLKEIENHPFNPKAEPILNPVDGKKERKFPKRS
jgi:cytoskeletal protein RodZ